MENHPVINMKDKNHVNVRLQWVKIEKGVKVKKKVKILPTEGFLSTLY